MESLRKAVCSRALRRLVQILESAAHAKRLQCSTFAGKSLIEKVQNNVNLREKDQKFIDKVPDFPYVTHCWARELIVSSFLH